MKRVLLCAISFFITAELFGQTIENQNFESFTVGNLATDPTGTTAGQGGYKIYSGTAADYQITILTAAQGKSLTVSTPNTASGTRYAYKDITTVAAAGNNYLKASFKLHTGSAAGAGKGYFSFFDAEGAGIVGINYDFATKKLTGMARLTPTGGTPTYYNIGALGTSTYPANTWVSVTVEYNKTTGGVAFVTPEGSYHISTAPTGYTLNPNAVPSEFDFYAGPAAGNSVVNTVGFDDVNILYTNNSVLSTNEVNTKTAVLSLYPNPASDFLNIKSDEKIKSVSVFDMAGRKIEVKADNNQVDVRHLQSGSYIIAVETANGIVSEKFIKK